MLYSIFLFLVDLYLSFGTPLGVYFLFLVDLYLSFGTPFGVYFPLPSGPVLIVWHTLWSLFSSS